jgi:hypothetical protein
VSDTVAGDTQLEGTRVAPTPWSVDVPARAGGTAWRVFQPACGIFVD